MDTLHPGGAAGPGPQRRACEAVARSARVATLVVVLAAVLAGCATRGTPSAPTPATRTQIPPGNSQRDGPEAHPPPDLDKVPDAVPKIEPVRPGGPNKPYEIEGRTYVPLTDDRPVVQRGLASWYGKRFHGHRTSSGEAYNMYAMTAAHPTLPIPSYARVRNPANGKEVIVRVNDRGPFSPGRIIDLSYTAALKLGVLGGVTAVEVERITTEAIRTGSWLPAGSATALAPAGPPTLPAVVAGGPPPLGDELLVGQAAIPPDVAVITTTITRTPGPPPAPPAAAAREESSKAFTPDSVGFWVQLGAYKQRDGALGFQKRVGDQAAWLAPLLAVYEDRGLHKLQAGPFASRDQAQQAAERVRTDLQLVPSVVEKR